jgi:tetratricopeptide (TPR) repeat protein
MRDPSRYEQAGLLIATTALQENNPQEAVKILSEMIEADPENVDLLLARANAYAGTRVNVEEALADVERIRALDPDNLEAYRPEILAHLSAVQQEEAAAALDALGKRLESEEGPEGMEAWYCTTMALFAMESKERELARERFDACVEAHPADPSVALAASDFFRDARDLDRAIEITDRAQELFEGPGDSGLTGRRVELYVARGDVAGAESLLVEAAAVENPGMSLRYKLGLSEFYESLGRFDEAVGAYREAIALLDELGRPTGSARTVLADLLIQAGDLEGAAEVARGLAHPPFKHMVEARIAQERDEHRKAIELYAETARLWPDNEFVRYHAARSAEQIGDFEAAMELYRHAARISTESTNAISRIAVLLDASGHYQDALSHLLIQQQRAPLDEIGELLKVELMARSRGVDWLPAYLQAVPLTDSIGRPKRLASAMRGLRLRPEPDAVLVIARQVDARALGANGGGAVIEEVVLAAEGRPEGLELAESMLGVASTVRPGSAELEAVRGLLARHRGEDEAAIEAAYAHALELDARLPAALLGLALLEVDSDPQKALDLGRRALEAKGVSSDRVASLALALMKSGADEQALELSELLIRHTPHEATAAELLARAALAAGDHSDRTLDLARRAARFGRTEASLVLLRDTYAARGETERARQVAERLEERKQGAGEPAASPGESGAG